MVRILGIETTCDETSFAVVEDGTKVLYEFTISQAKKHSQYGGVVPELAAREHIKNIQKLLPQLKEIITNLRVDYVAVAAKVGLPPAVMVGEAFAEGLGQGLGVPTLKVDHVIAHVWGVWLDSSFKEKPTPPFLGLVLSGGHSSIIKFKTLTDYEILAQTMDDALGEVFDKIARHLGLGYPGGPVIERLAKEGDEYAVRLPVPLENDSRMAFSFSGLKTAVIRTYDTFKQDTYEEYQEFLKYDMAASFQRVAFEHVAQKISAAIEKTNLDTVVLGGGVAANQRLIDILAQKLVPTGVKLYVPPLKYTGDNAALIAGYAYNLVSTAS